MHTSLACAAIPSRYVPAVATMAPAFGRCRTLGSYEAYETLFASLDAFTLAYVEAALWTSTDESDDAGGSPMDRNYSAEDIAPSTLASMAADCARFQGENAETLAASYGKRGPYGAEKASPKLAGHLLWLTRNGHGCGFDDGSWPNDAAQDATLYASAKTYREVYLTVDDEGIISDM